MLFILQSPHLKLPESLIVYSDKSSKILPTPWIHIDPNSLNVSDTVFSPPPPPPPSVETTSSDSKLYLEQKTRTKWYHENYR